jgi:sugar phosphate isomerase/epimerase
MNLSLSNGVFYKHTLSENLAAVRDLNFENLEFNMKCVQEDDEDSVYTAKEHMKALGLRCLTLHAATLHVKEEKEIPRAIYYGRVSADFAGRLSSTVLVVHSNVSKKLSQNQRNDFVEKIFGELTSYTEDLHFKIALENLSYASDGFGKNVAELEEILGIVDDRTVGITLDFCHAEATGQTQDILKKFHQKIRNVHISDRAHRPFKLETTRLKDFVAKLRSYDYKGPLTIELNPKCTIEEIRSTKAILERLVQQDEKHF